MILHHACSYQEEPEAVAARLLESTSDYQLESSGAWPSVGFLPRFAITRGDLAMLRMVYCAPRRCQNDPLFSFDLAMHFAAMEGRLEILQWLHKLPGDIHKCRPDTMAAAARSGWADIVEWLHLHCPESGLTICESVINEVVERGFVDVLRVCLKYSLVKFTARTLGIASAFEDQLTALLSSVPGVDEPAVLARVIRRGRLQIIEWCNIDHSSATLCEFNQVISQYLQLPRYGSSEQSCDIVVGTIEQLTSVEQLTLGWNEIAIRDLVDTAVKAGRVDLVQALCDLTGITLKAHHLALAMIAAKSNQDAMLEYIVSSGGQDIVRQCVLENFAAVCERGSPQGITLLLPVAMAILEEMRRQQLPEDTLTRRAISILLACETARCSIDIESMEEVIRNGRGYLVRAILQSGVVSTRVLGDCFRAAIMSKHVKTAEIMLMDCPVDDWCDDIFGLLERNALYELLPRYRNRTASDMIRVLRKVGQGHPSSEAKPSRVVRRIRRNAPVAPQSAVTSLITCQKLLAAEDTHYTRHAVLANAPDCVIRLVVRCLLQAKDATDRSRPFARILDQNNERLSVEELLTIIKSDPALLPFVIDHKQTLISGSLWVKAASDPNLDAFVFLCDEAKMAQGACTIKLETAKTWALSKAARTVISRGCDKHEEVTSPRSHRHGEVVVRVAKQQSETVQACVFGMVMQSLCKPVEAETETNTASRLKNLVDLVGVHVLRSIKSEYHQTLLPPAIVSGSREAAELLISLVFDTAHAEVKVLPLMVAAARSGQLSFIATLYTHKSTSEILDVTAIRQSFGVADATAAHTLLEVLEPLDSFIRDQLNQERSIFGVAANAKTPARSRRPGTTRRHR